MSGKADAYENQYRNPHVWDYSAATTQVQGEKYGENHSKKWL